MANEQDRPVSAGAAQSRDQISLARVRTENLCITRRESSVAEALSHGFSGERGAANRIGGIDFDELFENFARESLGRIISLRAKHHTGETEENGKREPFSDSHMHGTRPLRLRVSPGRIHWVREESLGSVWIPA